MNKVSYENCESCGLRISAPQLKRHTGSKRCRQETAIRRFVDPVRRSMDERGWCVVDGNWYKTIQNSGVDTEKQVGFAAFVGDELHIEEKWWAPKWAVQIASNTILSKTYRTGILKHCLSNEEDKDMFIAICGLSHDKMKRALAIMKAWESVMEEKGD